jgi:hypothetical protein
MNNPTSKEFFDSIEHEIAGSACDYDTAWSEVYTRFSREIPGFEAPQDDEREAELRAYATIE